jgi:hypothetical protein
MSDLTVKQQITMLKAHIKMLDRDVAKRPTLVKVDKLRALRKRLEQLEKQNVR